MQDFVNYLFLSNVLSVNALRLCLSNADVTICLIRDTCTSWDDLVTQVVRFFRSSYRSYALGRLEYARSVNVYSLRGCVQIAQNVLTHVCTVQSI